MIDTTGGAAAAQNVQEESKGRADADKATKNQVDMELQIIK